MTFDSVGMSRRRRRPRPGRGRGVGGGGGGGYAMPLRWGCGSCGRDSNAVGVIKKVVWRRGGFNEFVVWLCGSGG